MCQHQCIICHAAQFHGYHLGSLAAEEPEEDALELVPEDAVDDEVDRGVEGDEQVGDVVHPNMFDAQYLDQGCHNQIYEANVHYMGTLSF